MLFTSHGTVACMHAHVSLEVLATTVVLQNVRCLLQFKKKVLTYSRSWETLCVFHIKSILNGLSEDKINFDLTWNKSVIFFRDKIRESKKCWKLKKFEKGFQYCSCLNCCVFRPANACILTSKWVLCMLFAGWNNLLTILSSISSFMFKLRDVGDCLPRWVAQPRPFFYTLCCRPWQVIS